MMQRHDIASLFPPSKESSTESGKKLQALFKEFYSKKPVIENKFVDHKNQQEDITKNIATRIQSIKQKIIKNIGTPVDALDNVNKSHKKRKHFDEDGQPSLLPNKSFETAQSTTTSKKKHKDKFVDEAMEGGNSKADKRLDKIEQAMSKIEHAVDKIEQTINQSTDSNVMVLADEKSPSSSQKEKRKHKRGVESGKTPKNQKFESKNEEEPAKPHKSRKFYSHGFGNLANQTENHNLELKEDQRDFANSKGGKARKRKSTDSCIELKREVEENVPKVKSKKNNPAVSNFTSTEGTVKKLDKTADQSCLEKSSKKKHRISDSIPSGKISNKDVIIPKVKGFNLPKSNLKNDKCQAFDHSSKKKAIKKEMSDERNSDLSNSKPKKKKHQFSHSISKMQISDKYEDSHKSKFNDMDLSRTKLKKNKAEIFGTTSNDQGPDTFGDCNKLRKKVIDFPRGKSKWIAPEESLNHQENDLFLSSPKTSHFDLTEDALFQNEFSSSCGVKKKKLISMKTQGSASDEDASSDSSEEATPFKTKKNKISLETNSDSASSDSADELEAKPFKTNETEIKSKKKIKLQNINEKSNQKQIEDDSDETCHSEKSAVGKPKEKLKFVESEERLSRTLFIGNLNVEVNKKDLKSEFKKYGEIETIRLRGAVPTKTSISKKVANILNKFHSGMKSRTAFIVFKDVESISKAKALNGTLFQGRHIVVDAASPVQGKVAYNEQRSVFLGNLPFDIDEEAIWSAFSECGEIESVRVVRDKDSGVGKGYGFIYFKVAQAVHKALEFNGSEVSGRNIRVNRCGQKPAPMNKLHSWKGEKARALMLKKQANHPFKGKSTKKIMQRERQAREKKKVAKFLRS